MIIYCENGHTFSKNIADHIKKRKIICNEGICHQLYFECGICRSKQHITFENVTTRRIQAKIQECIDRVEFSDLDDLKLKLKL